MVDGVYAGVEIEPNTMRDALAQLVFYQRIKIQRKEVLLMASVIRGAEGEKIKDLYEDYKSALMPPLNGRKRSQEQQASTYMDNFENFASSIPKKLRRLDK
jgi:Cdc6-like AAA superfamily ATPase